MKDKQGLNRWSLLEQAGTVLDERFHHDAIYSHLVETAACGRQLEAEIARLRDEVERLRLTDAERSVLRGLRDDYAFRRSNENCQRVASVLDDLLARLGGDA